MRSNCPLNYGVEIFGDRWSLLIVRDLMFFGKRSYNEFLQSAEGIATNILRDRLTMLEKEKIIQKKKDPEHKQKIIYHLTEKGIDLLPVVIAIGLWSDKYATIKLHPGRDVMIGEAKKDFRRGIEMMRKRLKAEHLKKYRISNR